MGRGALSEAERSAAADNGAPDADMATLARGGRLNVFGFGLRLVARIPFIFIGSRIYGAAACQPKKTQRKPAGRARAAKPRAVTE